MPKLRAALILTALVALSACGRGIPLVPII